MAPWQQDTMVTTLTMDGGKVVRVLAGKWPTWSAWEILRMKHWSPIPGEESKWRVQDRLFVMSVFCYFCCCPSVTSVDLSSCNSFNIAQAQVTPLWAHCERGIHSNTLKFSLKPSKSQLIRECFWRNRQSHGWQKLPNCKQHQWNSMKINEAPHRNNKAATFFGVASRLVWRQSHSAWRSRGCMQQVSPAHALCHPPKNPKTASRC